MLKKAKAVPLHATKALGERKYSSYSFSTSVVDGMSGQRHASAPLYPQGKDSRYPFERGLDIEAGGKILYPCRGSKVDHPVVHTAAKHCTD
jgi:hypothetical protein